MAEKQLKISLNYHQNQNQKVTVEGIKIGVDQLAATVNEDSFTNIATVTFSAINGYYYNSDPNIIFDSNVRSYTVQQSTKKVLGYTTSKTFVINYKARTSSNTASISFNTELKYLELTPTVVQGFKVAAEEHDVEKFVQLEKNVSDLVVAEANAIQELDKGNLLKLQVTSVFVGATEVNPGGEERAFSVLGNAGALYNLSITRVDTNASYDPLSKTFTAAQSQFTNAPVNTPIKIIFPSTETRIVYRVIFTPTNSVYSGGSIPDLIQGAGVEAVFSLSSADNASSYNTLPASITNVIGSTEKEITFDVSLSEKAFIEIPNKFDELLRLDDLADLFTISRQVLVNDPDDVNAGKTTITLDTVQGLQVGFGVTGGSPFSVSAGAQFITDINAETNTINVTSTQDVSDNLALTFTPTAEHGKNGSAVSALEGGGFTVKSVDIKLKEVETTTDAVSTSSTTVNLTSTVGCLAAVTQTVDVSTVGQSSVVLDSVANLVTGMRLVKSSSSTLLGEDTPSGIVITKLKAGSKKVGLSTGQSLTDGETLTFGRTRVQGVGIKGNPYVSTVSAGASVVVEPSAQILESGAAITLSGTSRTASIIINLTNVEFGTFGYNANLNLDKLLQVV